MSRLGLGYCPQPLRSSRGAQADFSLNVTSIKQQQQQKKKIRRGEKTAAGAGTNPLFPKKIRGGSGERTVPWEDTGGEVGGLAEKLIQLAVPRSSAMLGLRGARRPRKKPLSPAPRHRASAPPPDSASESL